MSKIFSIRQINFDIQRFADDICKIGDTCYNSLESAIEAANADQTITILTDLELKNTIEIRKTIILDLAGYKIWGNLAWQDMIYIKKDATLTVMDTSEEQEGQIINNRNGYCINIEKDGTMNIIGGNFHKFNNSGVLNISGGTFTNFNNYGTLNFKTYNSNSGSFTLNGITYTVSGDDELSFIFEDNASIKFNNLNVGATLTISSDSEDLANLAITVNNVIFGNFNDQTSVTIKGTDSGAEILPDLCEINGKKFTSLESAIAEASNGNTIKLLSNIALTNETIEIDKTIKLDLNGKTISGSVNNNGLFEVSSNGNLTVEDNSDDKNGSITNNGDNCFNLLGGKLVIEDGNFTSTNDTIICSDNNSIVEINGGTFNSELDSIWYGTHKLVKNNNSTPNDSTDDTWTVLKEATVNDLNKFKAQIEAGNKYITLANDINLTECIAISSNFVIDLAGHKINGSISESFTIANNGNLTFMDSVGGGQVLNSTSGYTINNSGTLNIEGSNFSINVAENGTCIKNNTNATLNINGGCNICSSDGQANAKLINGDGTVNYNTDSNGNGIFKFEYVTFEITNDTNNKISFNFDNSNTVSGLSGLDEDARLTISTSAEYYETLFASKYTINGVDFTKNEIKSKRLKNGVTIIGTNEGNSAEVETFNFYINDSGKIYTLDDNGKIGTKEINNYADSFSIYTNDTLQLKEEGTKIVINASSPIKNKPVGIGVIAVSYHRRPA